jgi:hypothetical protein
MDWYYKIVDDITFRQLRESKYHNPILTEVMFDYDMMLEMVFHSMTIIEKGYDTVWDANVFNFIRKYFQEGMEYVEKLIKQNGIRIRLIVEATIENIDAINLLKYYEIRCLDDIKGNFGIFDNRAYMVCIFHRDSDKPDQTLWSNSKDLVDKQRILFDKMWNIAIPLSTRRKELEYEKRMGQKQTIRDFELLLNEIDSLIITCKKKLIIFSSTKVLCNILSKTDFVSYFPSLLKSGVKIKILIDNEDNILLKQINAINDTNRLNKVHLIHSSEMIELSECVIISDDKYMLQTKFDMNNQLHASFSAEGHNIILQEILFEKHWNEVKSLNTVKNN